jgi:hypothetical protein
LRLSIEARMRRVGGSAVVVSAPGRGTRVQLRWPAAPSDTNVSVVPARARASGFADPRQER